MTYVLAIDQGTTSSRAILYDGDMQIRAVAQEEFPQHFPSSGWVEHDPGDIWETVLRTGQRVITEAGVNPASVAGIGITNQRETTLIWDRDTGQPIHNAIVWQDRRTADLCRKLRADGNEKMISARTGLLLDPYFSATKIAWLLDNVEGARHRAEAGKLLVGTVDSFLIWKLTGGRMHATDATNASRTMLYDIHKGCWDAELCALLRVPMRMLPDVFDCAAEYGVTDVVHFGAPIAIRGVAGDQQAATIGQACFQPGMMKATYGTGCFALLNTGATAVTSKNRLLTTIAYQLNGQPTYALEGSIFIAGAVVQWLRDGLKIIHTAAETQSLAEAADPAQALVIVPAFTGLGAPYWNADCRGAIYGLTRNSGPAELARAALEGTGYQTRDLIEAMRADWPDAVAGVLRVDGGMTASDWAMQFLSDIMDAPVDRPAGLETTALGAGWLAGSQAGIYPDAAGFAQLWSCETRFSPTMAKAERDAKYTRWKRAVAATLTV